MKARSKTLSNVFELMDGVTEQLRAAAIKSPSRYRPRFFAFSNGLVEAIRPEIIQHGDQLGAGLAEQSDRNLCFLCAGGNLVELLQQQRA